MMSVLHAADQRFGGVVIGVVSDVDDPDGIGRVRIRLPWYGDGYEEWARVGQLYAGNDYGSTWIPEVGGEVLVAFAHGDMRWPYVIGCLHGKVDRPPVSRTSSTDVRTIRTPSGSELSFDEVNGEIAVRTKSGASLTLNEKSGELTVTAQNRITLRADQIRIEGTSEVTVKGSRITLN
jgi:phage baseplate assembly protein V